MTKWFRFLFPGQTEKSIAKRYLFSQKTNRKNTKSLFNVYLVLFIITGILSLGSIGSFFYRETPPTTLAMAALFLPLLTFILVLLRFFSVFITSAISGLTIGIAALILVNSTISGFMQQISQKTYQINGSITLKKDADAHISSINDYPLLKKQLEEHPSVSMVAPVVQTPVFVSKVGWPPKSLMVHGIDPTNKASTFIKQFLAPNNGKKPQLSDLEDYQIPKNGGPALPTIFIGTLLARQLNLQPGDTVRLVNMKTQLNYSPNEDPTESETESEFAPVQDFIIAGLFQIGYERLDETIVCTSILQSQRLLGKKDIFTSVLIYLHDEANVGETINQLSNSIVVGYTLAPVTETMLAALATQRFGISLLMFLIVLVATFNIIASLTILVINKTQEIAILRTIGLSPSQISSIFRTIGLYVGILGTIFGAGLGLLGSAILEHLRFPIDASTYTIDHLSTKISIYQISAIVILSLTICLLATLYPALRAAKLHPVDGLRKE